VINECRKFAGLVQPGAQKTGDHLDDSRRGKEDVILSSCTRGEELAKKEKGNLSRKGDDLRRKSEKSPHKFDQKRCQIEVHP